MEKLSNNFYATERNKIQSKSQFEWMKDVSLNRPDGIYNYLIQKIKQRNNISKYYHINIGKPLSFNPKVSSGDEVEVGINGNLMNALSIHKADLVAHRWEVCGNKVAANFRFHSDQAITKFVSSSNPSWPTYTIVSIDPNIIVPMNSRVGTFARSYEAMDSRRTTMLSQSMPRPFYKVNINNDNKGSLSKLIIPYRGESFRQIHEAEESEMFQLSSNILNPPPTAQSRLTAFNNSNILSNINE